MIDDLKALFFDNAYSLRVPLVIGSVVAAVVLLLLARGLGWFAAARRHPARAAAFLVVALAIGIPVSYYLTSPLFIRTQLIEPDPVAGIERSPTPVVSQPSSPAVGAPSPTREAPMASASVVPTEAATSVPTVFKPAIVAAGEFRGTDDFHFGRGTASIVETAPDTYVLRLADFSVRNGPDLFVYLSPDASDYVHGALELGTLKATDGAFGYQLPAGTDPADFKSAIIWCKQFSQLFAVAPLDVV